MSVNSQTPYAAYQPQPTKAPVNRSGFFIKYDLKEEIGVGSTSKCYRCSRKSDGQNFACKVIDKRQVEVKFTGLLDQFFVEINVSYRTRFINYIVPPSYALMDLAPLLHHLRSDYTQNIIAYFVTKLILSLMFSDCAGSKNSKSSEYNSSRGYI